MIDPPEIVHTTAQPAALIHLTVRRNQMREVMGPGLSELRAALKSQGIEPTGPWFAHHLKMDGKVFDFEIGLPVASPVAAQGRMKPGVLPAATIARTHYRGPYEGLPGAWPELEAWIEANGHESALDLWEVYVVDPSVSADPAAWTTQLNRPLAAPQAKPKKKKAAAKPTKAAPKKSTPKKAPKAPKKPAPKAKKKPAPKAAKKTAPKKAAAKK